MFINQEMRMSTISYSAEMGLTFYLCLQRSCEAFWLHEVFLKHKPIVLIADSARLHLFCVHLSD